MDNLYAAVIAVCGNLQVVSDFLWQFPTNIDWYASIPIVGNFSLAIIVLVGTGIFFTFRFGFVQFRYFGRGIKIMMQKSAEETGISPLASFLLSSAMRIGPGNILGVTGAISIGGPGALFWMWVSAIFAMATSFVESTISQIFKERDGKDFIGGMPFYGRRLARGAVWVGVALSCLYIVYAFLCLPAQGFNTISGINMIGSAIVGYDIPVDSMFNLIAFICMIVFVTVLTFGGIKKVSRFTDRAVPFMAVIYLFVTVVLILLHANLIPWFFATVISEAFVPNAIFGGAFGVALSQGIRRGLMSNEAGQGTISMAAAASNAKHPCEQGSIQSLGVFFDTVVICTPTAFVVILSQMWLGDSATEWFAAGKLQAFIMSCDALVWNEQTASMIVTIIVSLCFGMFALTTLAGFLSFTEMCAKRISKNKVFIFCVRIMCLLVITFGVAANAAGLDLSALWNLSDLANIMMVYVNVPLLYVGLRYALRAYKHYNKYTMFYEPHLEWLHGKKKTLESERSDNVAANTLNGTTSISTDSDKADGESNNALPDDKYFNSKIAGIDLPVWDEIEVELHEREKHKARDHEKQELCERNN